MKIKLPSAENVTTGLMLLVAAMSLYDPTMNGQTRPTMVSTVELIGWGCLAGGLGMLIIKAFVKRNTAQ